MSASLVGSEMCIRDRSLRLQGTRSIPIGRPLTVRPLIDEASRATGESLHRREDEPALRPPERNAAVAQAR
eukprot:14008661-Alexandrium_andersonii.AAC.1